MDDPQPLPTSLDGHPIVAICPVYLWADRADYVAITTWDEPTPYVVRELTVAKGEVISHGSGEYHFTLAVALQAFRDRIPR